MGNLNLIALASIASHGDKKRYGWMAVSIRLFSQFITALYSQFCPDNAHITSGRINQSP